MGSQARTETNQYQIVQALRDCQRIYRTGYGYQFEGWYCNLEGIDQNHRDKSLAIAIESIWEQLALCNSKSEMSFYWKLMMLWEVNDKSTVTTDNESDTTIDKDITNEKITNNKG